MSLSSLGFKKHSAYLRPIGRHVSLVRGKDVGGFLKNRVMEQGAMRRLTGLLKRMAPDKKSYGRAWARVRGDGIFDVAPAGTVAPKRGGKGLHAYISDRVFKAPGSLSPRGIVHHELFHARVPVLGRSEVAAHFYGGLRHRKGVLDVGKGMDQIGHLVQGRPVRALLELGPLAGASVATGALGGKILADREKKKLKKHASIADNIRAYWRNLRDVTGHKVDVYRAGRQLGVPRTQLLRHDLSKYRPSEFIPYAQWLHHPEGRLGAQDPARKQRFREAAELHYSRNPHHWRRMGIAEEDKRKKVLKEGLADWYSAARRAGTEKTFPQWYEKHRDNLQLREDVQRKADKRLLKQAGILSQMKSQLFKGLKLQKPTNKKSMFTSMKGGITRTKL